MAPPILNSLITRLLRSGVFWSALVTLVRAAGFVLVLPLVLRTLPTQEVGLWYIYSGVAGFCAMIEIGFSTIISRFTSFYQAGVEGLPSLETLLQSRSAGQPNEAGLLGLIQLARKLYRVFAMGSLCAMILSGGWLILKYGEVFLQPLHLLSFALMLFGTVWSMSEYFWAGMLFGINRVKEYHQAILEGILLNYLIIVLGMSLHWGLISLVLGQVTLAVYQRIRSRSFFRQSASLPEDIKPLPILWQHLWPMTWRGGLMGLGMYMSFLSLTLVCAQVFDLESTARFALSLQLVVMASGLANTWLMVKYPTISTWHVGGRFREIRRLVAQRLFLQMGTYVVICLIAHQWAPEILHYLGAKTNFLAPAQLTCLMAVAGFDLLVNSGSSIVQCGNQFPFVKSKLANGLLTIGLAFSLAHYWGMFGLIMAPFVAQLSFNAWYIGFWCWSDLHRHDPPPTPVKVVMP